MHQDFRVYDIPVTARTCSITRARLASDQLNYNVRPIRERLGHEPTRAQYAYTAIVDGCTAGELQMIELEPGLAFVAWVGVVPAYRRRGVAEALHRRVIADLGSLAVEDFASDAELYLIAALRESGLVLGVRSLADLEINRHCKIVDRVYTITAVKA